MNIAILKPCNNYSAVKYLDWLSKQ